jgi:hypothetical protein
MYASEPKIARRESDMLPTSVSRGSNRLQRGLVAAAVAVALPAAFSTSPAAAITTSPAAAAGDCIVIVTKEGTRIYICPRSADD